jgi:hypothetical protein
MFWPATGWPRCNPAVARRPGRQHLSFRNAGPGIAEESAQWSCQRHTIRERPQPPDCPCFRIVTATDPAQQARPEVSEEKPITVSRHVADDPARPVCAACGHDEASHGTVAARFCRATIDRNLERRCVCEPAEAAAQDEPAMYGRGRYSGR